MQAEESNLQNDRTYHLAIATALAGLALTISLFIWPDMEIRFGATVGFILGSVFLSNKWAHDSGKIERKNTDKEKIEE